MCAIAGSYGKHHYERTRDALSVMRHRGPDETVVNTFSKNKFSFGMNRLAIRDLHRGLYPFSYKGLRLFYNGELYNVQDIVQRLGYTPKTACDGEVILPLYFKYGVSCFDQFVGMFAVAIFDEKANTLVLARDKFGEKPLYYRVTDEEVLFGSELKIFTSERIDPGAVERHLSFGYQPFYTTIYENVSKVLPGEVITIYLHNRSIEKRWYGKNFFVTKHESSDNRPEYIEESVKLLDKALNGIVREKIVSDAPLGIFLSGGVDSALLAALVQRHTQAAVRTYSVRFDHPHYDESSSSQVVARHLHTGHTEILVTGETVHRVWDEVIKNLDEPFADPAIFPTYLLSRVAKQHVKVILSGEGADELFGGYPHYRNALRPGRCIKVPQWLAEIAMSIRPPMRFMRLVGLPDTLYTSAQYNIYKYAGKGFRRHYLHLLRQAWSELDDNYQIFRVPLPLRRMQYDLRYYVGEQLCMKIDKMTMLHSIESRAPYLDDRLVQFMQPSAYLLQGGYQDKYLLRSVARHYLPPKIANREKHGFSLPLEHWLRGELRDIVERALDPHAYMQGVVSKDIMSNIINGFLSKKHNDALAVWNVVVLDAWLKTHVG